MTQRRVDLTDQAWSLVTTAAISRHVSRGELISEILVEKLLPPQAVIPESLIDTIEGDVLRRHLNPPREELRGHS